MPLRHLRSVLPRSHPPWPTTLPALRTPLQRDVRAKSNRGVAVRARNTRQSPRPVIITASSAISAVELRSAPSRADSGQRGGSTCLVDWAPVVVLRFPRGGSVNQGVNTCQKKQPSTTERQRNIVRSSLTIITKQQNITRLDITKRPRTTRILRGDTRLMRDTTPTKPQKLTLRNTLRNRFENSATP